MQDESGPEVMLLDPSPRFKGELYRIVMNHMKKLHDGIHEGLF